MHLLFHTEWESGVFLIDSVTYQSSMAVFLGCKSHELCLKLKKKLFRFRFNIKKMSNNS